MSERMVDQVRSFNRFLTQHVGALNDSFLGRGRPLGEARLLWEIGLGDCEVRLLRARLGLDSGYLSRLLRSLKAAGLVEVLAGDGDRRTRFRGSPLPAGASARASISAPPSWRNRS